MYTACILYTIYFFNAHWCCCYCKIKEKNKSLKLDHNTMVEKKKKIESHLQSNLKALISHSFNNLMESLNRLCWNIVAIHWCLAVSSFIFCVCVIHLSTNGNHLNVYCSHKLQTGREK